MKPQHLLSILFLLFSIICYSQNKVDVALSVGPSFSIWEFGSQNVNNESAGLATSGTIFDIAYAKKIGHDAELHIINNSDRTMDIKVIRVFSASSSTLFGKMHIAPQSKSVKYFSATGNYYLKVKASRLNRPDVYSKGDPFRVYVGSDGYDVLTITYSIEESTLNPLDGETISKAEFERDN